MINKIYEKEIQNMKDFYLHNQDMKLEVIWSKRDPNYAVFLSVDGDLQFSFNLKSYKDMPDFSHIFPTWSGKAIGWENTLNIDFSKRKDFVFAENCVTDEIIEKYISKWDLSSCKLLVLSWNYITNIGIDIIYQMCLPKIKHIDFIANNISKKYDYSKFQNKFPTLRDIQHDL